MSLKDPRSAGARPPFPPQQQPAPGQTAQLEPLYREMVKALGELAVRNNDSQLRDMLAKHGVVVNLPALPPSPAPAPEPKKAK